MNKCEEFSAMLAARAEGSLGADDTLTLDRHLVSCPSCAAQLEDLRRLEAICAGIRSATAGDSEIAKLKEAVMTTLPVPTHAHHANSVLRPLFSHRWFAPAAAAAAVFVIAILLVPAFHGSSGITWAAVVTAVESAPWVHYVTTDSATGEVVYDEWGTPDSREIYIKVDKGRFRHGPFTDYIRGKQWSKDTTVANPDVHRTISAGRVEGSSTVFDITYGYEDHGNLTWWGQARKERAYVDNATMRPTRIESECYSNLNRENETTHYVTAIDYPSTGPSEALAIGMPHASAPGDVQPPADSKAVSDEYVRHRDAFAAACTEYRALYLTDAGSSDFTYLLDSRGAAYRLEMYVPGAPGDLILAGKLPPFSSVEISDGARRRDWKDDGTTKESRQSPNLRHSAGLRECEPVNFSWPGLGQGVQLIKSDAPVLAGLIGLESTSTIGEVARHRFWINPQRDYILQRWEWDEFKGGKWEPFRREEVVDYAKLSTGQYYASAKRIYGAQFATNVTYSITEHPTFDKDAFNPDVSPWATVWATAIITLTNAPGATSDDMKLFSLIPGWEPKSKLAGGTFTVTNLPRAGSSQMLLSDEKRGLVKAITITPVEGTAKLDVTLEPGIQLSGLVKDESGSPIAGVDMLLDMLADSDGIPSNMGGIEHVRTDASGRYVFHLVTPGVQFGVEAHRSGFQRGQTTVEIDSAARTAIASDITMSKASSIGGCVTDGATGLPIEGLTVRINVNHAASYAASHMWDVYGRSYSDWEEKTDKDGRWSFGCNSRYVYKVRILDTRYRTEALGEALPGAANVDFKLTPVPSVAEPPK